MRPSIENAPLGKPSTVRLGELERLQLEGLALVDETSFAEEIRKAAQHYVDIRFANPALGLQIEVARNRIDEIFSSFVEKA